MIIILIIMCSLHLKKKKYPTNLWLAVTLPSSSSESAVSPSKQCWMWSTHDLMCSPLLLAFLETCKMKNTPYVHEGQIITVIFEANVCSSWLDFVWGGRQETTLLMCQKIHHHHHHHRCRRRYHHHQQQHLTLLGDSEHILAVQSDSGFETVTYHLPDDLNKQSIYIVTYLSLTNVSIIILMCVQVWGNDCENAETRHTSMLLSRQQNPANKITFFLSFFLAALPVRIEIIRSKAALYDSTDSTVPETTQLCNSEMKDLWTNQKQLSPKFF